MQLHQERQHFAFLLARMPFVEKEKKSSFEESPIDGLFCLDGALIGSRELTRNYKEIMILFPSRFTCPVGENAEGVLVVNVLGKVWLPYQSTRDEGWQEASQWAEFLGYPYPLKKIGDDTLEMWGKREHRLEKVDLPHILIKYDNDQRRMVNVVQMET